MLGKIMACALAGVSAMGLAVPTAAAQARSSERRNFDIPAQDMAGALEAFGRQSGKEIIFERRQLSRLRARAVGGSYTPDEALRRLIEGTGLVVRLVNRDTFVVESVSQTRSENRSPTYGDKDEIVVTGTLIRGVGGSVGTPVETINRDDIERSGQGNVQDIIKTSPLVFQGGASDDSRSGGSAANNAFFGAGVDIRGLGTASTLTLLNGRRLPLAGGADFVDVSSIPASAIERIEILPDGASALYGSDAIGGVVNIILRDNYEGAETSGRVGFSTQGGGNDWRLSQAFGKRWNGGHALLSFEYYARQALDSADRAFTRSADLRPLGGDDFRNNLSNPGNIISLTGGPNVAIPAGQDGTSLTPADLLPGVTNLNNQNEGVDRMPRQRRWSLFGTANQEIGSGTEIFVEGRYSRRHFQARSGGFGTQLLVTPANPFFVSPTPAPFVVINYNFIDDLGPATFDGQVDTFGAVVGANQDMWGDWQLKAYGSYSREKSDFVTVNVIDRDALTLALADPNPDTAFNPFGDGSNTNPATIEKIRGSNTFKLDSRLWSVNATADGTLVTIPGGDVKLAAGIDYREENFDRTFTPPVQGLVDFPASRNILALFGELYAPLIGPDNGLPGLYRLVISAAARYDKYTGDGANSSTTNPKVGFLYSPVEGFNLRGSFGTSFKAPKLLDLDETFNGTLAFPLPDPSAPGGTTLSLLRTGKNRDLRNETAKTWSIGFEALPPAVPGLKIGLNYFNIDYKNRISSPSLTTEILTQPERYASIIIRNPSQDQIDAICNSPEYRFADPATCVLLPIGAIVDARLNNTARTKVQGIDFNLSYNFPLEGIGRLHLATSGSYFMSYKESFSPGSRAITLVDTVGNPASLRIRNSIVWSGPDGLSAAAFVNYTGSYLDNVSQPNRMVDAWTTVDLNLLYDLGERRGLLSGLRISASVVNVFDKDPPFANISYGLGYDPQNADPLGRFVSLTATKRW